MSKSIEQLILALTKEHEMYRDYLEIANKKKDVIISGQVKELESITNIEQRMIVNMGRIDHIRNSIIGNFLTEQELESVGSLSELAEHLSQKDQAKVLELKDKLEKIINEIMNVNELNGSLIKQSLDYIDFNMNLMMSLETKGSTYGNNADQKDLKERNNVLDVKI